MRMQVGRRPANHRASRTTILVAALIALIVTGLLVYLAAVAPRGVPTLDYVDIDAEFVETAEIKLLSSVTVNGRRVGQVSEITSDGEVAHLNLQLEPGTEIRSDSVARIRVKNPVGAKYVDITQGTGGEVLSDEDVLPATQTSTSIDTPDLLATFDEPTRRNLQTSVGGLATGFLGRGQDINETLPDAAPVVDRLNSISTAILEREGAAARFFPSLASLAGAYDPVREDLAAGFDPQATVLEAFADRRASLEATLDVAPPALVALRDGLDRARPFLDETARFARAVTRLSRPAPAALRDATDLLSTAGPALRDTQPLLAAIGDAVDPTIGALEAFRPQIDPTLRLLSNQIAPLRELSVRPCDFLLQGDNWRSALSYGVPVEADPTSELDFAQGIGANNNSFRVLGVPPVTTEALLPDQGILPPTVAQNAYPAACTAPEDSK